MSFSFDSQLPHPFLLSKMSTNSTLGGSRKQVFFHDSVLNHEGAWEWAGTMAQTIYVRTSEWDTCDEFYDFCKTLYPNFKQGMRHKVSTTADYAQAHDPLLSICLTVSQTFLDSDTWHIYDVPESARDFDTLSRMAIMEAKLVSLRDAIESTDARLAVETSKNSEQFEALEDKIDELSVKEDLSGSTQTLNQLGSAAGSSTLKSVSSDLDDNPDEDSDDDQITIMFESASGTLPLHVAAILKTLKQLPKIKCVDDNTEGHWHKNGEQLMVTSEPKKWKFGYSESDMRDGKESLMSDAELLSPESSDAFSSDWSAISDGSKDINK